MCSPHIENYHKRIWNCVIKNFANSLDTALKHSLKCGLWISTFFRCFFRNTCSALPQFPYLMCWSCSLGKLGKSKLCNVCEMQLARSRLWCTLQVKLTIQ